MLVSARMARDLKLTEAESAELETWRAAIGARSAVDVIRALVSIQGQRDKEDVAARLRAALPRIGLLKKGIVR